MNRRARLFLKVSCMVMSDQKYRKVFFTIGVCASGVFSVSNLNVSTLLYLLSVKEMGFFLPPTSAVITVVLSVLYMTLAYVVFTSVAYWDRRNYYPQIMLVEQLAVGTYAYVVSKKLLSEALENPTKEMLDWVFDNWTQYPPWLALYSMLLITSLPYFIKSKYGRYSLQHKKITSHPTSKEK